MIVRRKTFIFCLILYCFAWILKKLLCNKNKSTEKDNFENEKICFPAYDKCKKKMIVSFLQCNWHHYDPVIWTREGEQI